MTDWPLDATAERLVEQASTGGLLDCIGASFG
jgi:hypothetical protein